MAYDLELARRVRKVMQGLPGYQEKKMFGGIGFLIHGNMACGILGEELIVRVGPSAYAAALADSHVRPFDLTGRVMQGWVMVGPGGSKGEQKLATWVAAGADFARTLPPK